MIYGKRVNYAGVVIYKCPQQALQYKRLTSRYRLVTGASESSLLYHEANIRGNKQTDGQTYQCH